MRGSVTSIFSEIDDFQPALRAEGNPSLVVTRRGRFRARLTQIALNRLRLSDIEETLPRIAFVTVPADEILLALSAGDRPKQVWGGLEVRANELVTLGPGQCVHMRTNGPCHWGTIWLPPDDIARYSRALTGEQLTIPPVVSRWRPTASAGRELRNLHSVAVRAIRTRPEPTTEREAAHGLEQQLIHAVINCLSTGNISTGSAATQQFQELAVRFENLLAVQPEGELKLMAICAKLSVSDRDLRRCCTEQFGVSPSGYIRLHRLQAARHALRNGTPDQLGVAAVAERYGFHNPGRFAGLYYDLFGELPSLTLRHGLHEPSPRITGRQRAASARRAG